MENEPHSAVIDDESCVISVYDEDANQVCSTTIRPHGNYDSHLRFYFIVQNGTIEFSAEHSFCQFKSCGGYCLQEMFAYAKEVWSKKKVVDPFEFFKNNREVSSKKKQYKSLIYHRPNDDELSKKIKDERIISDGTYYSLGLRNSAKDYSQSLRGPFYREGKSYLRPTVIDITEFRAQGTCGEVKFSWYDCFVMIGIITFLCRKKIGVSLKNMTRLSRSI